jgi:hypothetical protein
MAHENLLVETREEVAFVTIAREGARAFPEKRTPRFEGR